MTPKFRTYSTVYQLYFTQGEPDLESLQSFIFHYGDQPLESFTGLNDKNNKEIFEGDILFAEKNFFIVVFRRGGYFLDSLTSFYFSSMAEVLLFNDTILNNHLIVGNARQGILSETHKRQFRENKHTVEKITQYLLNHNN